MGGREIGKGREINVPIIGSIMVTCPECGNQDLINAIQGFYLVQKGSPQGQLVDPRTAFICVNKDCKNIFDIMEGLKAGEKKAAEADKEQRAQELTGVIGAEKTEGGEKQEEQQEQKAAKTRAHELTEMMEDGEEKGAEADKGQEGQNPPRIIEGG